jgi:purine-binding chemotaxis protein CheW
MAENSELQNAGVLQGQVSDEGQLVVFRLADEEFGININSVKEIVRLPDITPIPRSPEYVAGICNLRGCVLPVIDTRTRFSMESGEATDHTRLLVVEANGQSTGLIVDDMREVMRVNESLLEPPPSVCRGVDREFLSGVVKMNEGNRLILTLNLEEVIAVEAEKDKKSAAEKGAGTANAGRHEEIVEEEQLVSFKIADEEYAFNISKVREILKVKEVTEVPNVPDYVKGLFTIRNQLMPVLDLRGLLGISSLIAERQEMIDRGVEEHQTWMENVRNALKSGMHSAVSDFRKAAFGKWLESYNTSSIEIEAALKRLKRVRKDFSDAATRAFEARAVSRKENQVDLEEIESHSRVMLDVLGEFRNAIEAYTSEDQRIMVVDADEMSIGYLVDCVDEVIRIPKSIIDETPLLASSARRELRGVAKLNEGERLIMIMDESALVGRETTRILSKLNSDAGSSEEDGDMQEKSLAQQSMSEEQLVTFTINREEYGIRIMQVQEINRLTEITSVPRAPYFIDGMTNLRGNVIPVINVRELFGLENKEVDDRTRIIIVDIAGNKTGLRVDQVNEVLRLSKHDIESTPSIVTSGKSNRFMDGVCKLDGGKRMVMLLDVEQVLDQSELQSMSSLGEGYGTEEPRKTKSVAAADKKRAAKKKV